MSEACSIHTMRDDVALDVDAEDVAGVLADLVGVGGELHAAGLAATADVHLGLHHHRVADRVGGGDGLVDRVDRATVGHRDAERGEELLALVFEKIHGGKASQVPDNRPKRRRGDASGRPDSPGARAVGILAAMSPVQPTKTRSPRSMVLAVAGVVLGIVLVLVIFVFAVPTLTESGKVEVKLGSTPTAPARPRPRPRPSPQDGPLLLPDVSGRNERDIYLQHIGDDPATGWYAFDARRPGQPRDCSLEWQSEAQEFVDPCDGTVVPADGAGLIAYQVTVTEDGNLVIDLNTDDARPPRPRRARRPPASSSPRRAEHARASDGCQAQAGRDGEGAASCPWPRGR